MSAKGESRGEGSKQEATNLLGNVKNNGWGN